MNNANIYRVFFETEPDSNQMSTGRAAKYWAKSSLVGILQDIEKEIAPRRLAHFHIDLVEQVGKNSKESTAKKQLELLRPQIKEQDR